jgi:alginate O-acetyltransferase complex protein AlgI
VLFNSLQFLLFFFPIVVVLYYVFARGGRRYRDFVLLFASFWFYAWWDVRFVTLLAGSILVNCTLGKSIAMALKRGARRRADMLLAAAVVFDLGTLGVFKYAHFFIANINAVAGTSYAIGAVILPLGISFFTFEQIGFVVDQRRGADYHVDILSYAIFVSFFPRLVAGPILRYDEIVPQLAFPVPRRSALDDLAVGLTIFVIGLIKKSVLADGIAPYASSVFAAAAQGQPVDLFLSWGGVLAYTCQLYFDFSGYSDMAIGAARCLGIRLPMNFFSPYKATSIIEFWRRWHITLSRFLRDYLYISLGGNRRGLARRYVNLCITMLLGGLWHGANWTFVIWGGLHGFFLMVNHGWRALAGRSAVLSAFRCSPFGAAAGFVLTFVAVVVGWVFFRAATFAAAGNLLFGMVGRHGASLPEGLAFALRPAAGFLAWLGIGFGAGSGSTFAVTWLWVLALLGIAWLLPSTQELLAPYAPVLEIARERMPIRARAGLVWRPSRSWALAMGVLALLAMISITRVSEFLYWQF